MDIKGNVLRVCCNFCCMNLYYICIFVLSVFVECVWNLMNVYVSFTFLYSYDIYLFVNIFN